MSDKNVKLTLEGGDKAQESTSSYLLNVEVLDELKHAIRQAREGKPSTGKNKQK